MPAPKTAADEAANGAQLAAEFAAQETPWDKCIEAVSRRLIASGATLEEVTSGTPILCRATLWTSVDTWKSVYLHVMGRELTRSEIEDWKVRQAAELHDSLVWTFMTLRYPKAEAASQMHPKRR